MQFNEWKQWVLSLPWTLRWFVLLVLVRSVLDTLYFLKDISPFLSPLYIIGVLTPILVIASFFSKNFPQKHPSALDTLFGFWGILLVFNAIALMSGRPSLDNFGIAIKITSPIFIYFFVRHLIRSRRDLLGFLTTFLYGSIAPFAMLLYERFINPLGPEGIIYTRGYERYNGLYADVLSYAIFVIGAFLIASFFF